MNQVLMVNYFNQIEKEKLLSKRYTLIDTGKMPSENFNATILPKLPQKAQEYGFPLKLLNMIGSLDETNRNIIRVNQAWESISNSSEENEIYNTRNLYTIHSANAHIIHDIRRFIDDIISIHWILSQPKTVTDVKIDGLGNYLCDANKEYKEFDIFRSFLKQINDIENAYKHSIANNMSTLIGREEPYIFALYSKNNKNFLTPRLIEISLKQVITEFNDFYRYSFSLIEGIS